MGNLFKGVHLLTQSEYDTLAANEQLDPDVLYATPENVTELVRLHTEQIAQNTSDILTNRNNISSNTADIELLKTTSSGQSSEIVDIKNTISEIIIRDTNQDAEIAAKVSVSDLTDYVKNTDYATSQKGGVAKYYSPNGIQIVGGFVYTTPASEAQITNKSNSYAVITPSNLHFAVVDGLKNNTIELTDDDKEKIYSWLGVPKSGDNVVTLDTAQTITGPKTFTEHIYLANSDGTVDRISHLNNNFIIHSGATNSSVLNIDEGLEKIYAFNEELAFKSDIAEAAGTTVYVGGTAVADLSFSADPQTQINLLAEGLDADKSELTTNINTRVSKSGDTMTGELIASAGVAFGNNKVRAENAGNTFEIVHIENNVDKNVFNYTHGAIFTLNNSETPVIIQGLDDRPSYVSGSGIMSDLALESDIPTKVSDLTNDNNYDTVTNVDNKISSNLTTAKSYTDTKIADLIDSAPETLDTLAEVAQAIKDNETVVDALNGAIGNKADSSELAKYLPLAGGTMTGDITMTSGTKVINGRGERVFDGDGDSDDGRIYLGVVVGNNNRVTTILSNGDLRHKRPNSGYGSAILDGSNYQNYALPLTGGNITGELTVKNIAVATVNDIPNVPDWAMSENKPEYDYSEIKNTPSTGTIIYVDGTLSPEINFDADPQVQLNALGADIITILDDMPTKVSKSGDTVTGELVLDGGAVFNYYKIQTSGKAGSVFEIIDTTSSANILKYEMDTNIYVGNTNMPLYLQGYGNRPAFVNASGSHGIALQSDITTAISGLGTVFDFKGSKNTMAELPSTENEIGDVWYVISEEVGYIWLNDGTEDRWERFGAPIDLSGYLPLTGGNITGQLTIKNSSVATLNDVYTQTQIDNKLNNMFNYDVATKTLTITTT